MVGKQVLVQFKSNGSGSLEAHRQQFQTITDVYLDGYTVKTNTGDVWQVNPYGDKGADFIAVL